MVDIIDEDDTQTKAVFFSQLEAFIKKTIQCAGEGLEVETLVNTVVNKYYGKKIFSDQSRERSTHKWIVGMQVLVFSKSKARWIRGFIENIDDEGWLKLVYGNRVKCLHPESSEVKRPDSPGKPRSKSEVIESKQETKGREETLIKKVDTLKGLLKTERIYWGKILEEIMRVLRLNAVNENVTLADENEMVDQNFIPRLTYNRSRRLRSQSDPSARPSIQMHRRATFSAVIDPALVRNQLLIVLKQVVPPKRFNPTRKGSYPRNDAERVLRTKESLFEQSGREVKSPGKSLVKSPIKIAKFSVNESTIWKDYKPKNRKPETSRKDNKIENSDLPMIEQPKQNLPGITIRLSDRLNVVLNGRNIKEQCQKGEAGRTILPENDDWEVKIIQQWSHKDLMEFLKRDYAPLVESFVHTGYTGADIVNLDLRELETNDTDIRNRFISDIQARKEKSPISIVIPSGTETPERELGECQCDDTEQFAPNTEFSEYNVNLAENSVNGKALAPLTEDNLNKLGFNSSENKVLLFATHSDWSEGSAGSSSLIRLPLSLELSDAECPECEILPQQGQILTPSSRTSSHASTSNDSSPTNGKEQLSVNPSHVWDGSLSSVAYTYKMEVVKQVDKQKTLEEKSNESQSPALSDRKSEEMLIECSKRTNFLPGQLPGDTSDDKIRSKYITEKISNPGNQYIKSHSPSASSPIKFGSDLPYDPRDWSVDQVLEYMAMTVNSRTMDILRHESMDGVKFLGTSNWKLEELIPDYIEQEKVSAALLQIKDAIDYIDFPKRSRDSETIPKQMGLYELIFPIKPRSQLHFPMPQFWDAEWVSEWLQDLEGGIFAKYIPNVKRLRLTGKLLLTDQMSFFGRIGLRDANELSTIRSYISNLTNFFKPVEILPAKWTTEHTQEFFRTQPDWDIAQYWDIFVRYQLNGEDLLTLNKKRLIDMGILSASHQRKISLLKKSLEVRVGEKVFFRGLHVKVKWIGFPRLPHCVGEWIGIELKSADAKKMKMRTQEKSKFHDGSVKGQRYFTSKIGCGLLVRRSEIKVRRRRNASY